MFNSKFQVIFARLQVGFYYRAKHTTYPEQCPLYMGAKLRITCLTCFRDEVRSPDEEPKQGYLKVTRTRGIIRRPFWLINLWAADQRYTQSQENLIKAKLYRNHKPVRAWRKKQPKTPEQLQKERERSKAINKQLRKKEKARIKAKMENSDSRKQVFDNKRRRKTYRDSQSDASDVYKRKEQINSDPEGDQASSSSLPIEKSGVTKRPTGTSTFVKREREIEGLGGGLVQLLTETIAGDFDATSSPQPSSWGSEIEAESANESERLYLKELFNEESEENLTMDETETSSDSEAIKIVPDSNTVESSAESETNTSESDLFLTDVSLARDATETSSIKSFIEKFTENTPGPIPDLPNTPTTYNREPHDETLSYTIPSQEYEEIKPFLRPPRMIDQMIDIFNPARKKMIDVYNPTRKYHGKMYYAAPKPWEITKNDSEVSSDKSSKKSSDPDYYVTEINGKKYFTDNKGKITHPKYYLNRWRSWHQENTTETDSGKSETLSSLTSVDESFEQHMYARFDELCNKYAHLFLEVKSMSEFDPPCALDTLKMFDNDIGFSSRADKRRIARKDYLNLVARLGRQNAFYIYYEKRTHGKFFTSDDCRRHLFVADLERRPSGYCIYCRASNETGEDLPTRHRYPGFHCWARYQRTNNMICLDCNQTEPKRVQENDKTEVRAPWLPSYNRMLKKILLTEFRPERVTATLQFKLSTIEYQKEKKSMAHLMDHPSDAYTGGMANTYRRGRGKRRPDRPPSPPLSYGSDTTPSSTTDGSSSNPKAGFYQPATKESPAIIGY